MSGLSDEAAALSARLDALAGVPDRDEAARALEDEVLPDLRRWFAVDRPIEALESVERPLKRCLRALAAEPGPVRRAARLARAQRRLGLLVKRKSYTLKLAHPLGYAVFLHEPGRGFSFQRHLEPKAEVFHILRALPGAFAFLCDFATWRRIYEPEALDAWLAGAPDPRFDAVATPVRPGDVLVVGSGETVHTVFGCHLEEFATTSEDRVDRLHDPNAGQPVPAALGHARARAGLAALVVPPESRREGRPIPPRPLPGGEAVALAEGPVTAVRYRVSGRTGWLRPAGEAAVSALHVLAGRGALRLGDADGEEAAIPADRGDTFTVAAGVAFALEGRPAEPLVVSEQRLPADRAFG